MSVELNLDSQIRGWVFLPLVVLSFLEAVICHHIQYLLTTTKKLDLQQVENSQALNRARLLRENGEWLPRISYLMRRHFFLNNTNGYLFEYQHSREPSIENPLTDPAMAMNMLRGNLTNIIPMVIGGGWINSMFNGFVATKVPFQLALRFKPMLQRGIHLDTLSPSWVSAVSWYFLNVFGIKSIHSLVLDDDEMLEKLESSQTSIIENMQNPQVLFKTEWEAMQIMDYTWQLEDIMQIIYFIDPLF